MGNYMLETGNLIGVPGGGGVCRPAAVLSRNNEPCNRASQLFGTVALPGTPIHYTYNHELVQHMYHLLPPCPVRHTQFKTSCIQAVKDRISQKLLRCGVTHTCTSCMTILCNNDINTNND